MKLLNRFGIFLAVAMGAMMMATLILAAPH
jgi:hypothetical protein